MKEKLLTIILFLLLTIRVGIANDIVIPNNSLPYNIFKTVELPYAAHSTTSVFQDKKGMIWIGTYHGVCRYDGYKTTLYMTGQSIMGIAQTDDQPLDRAGAALLCGALLLELCKEDAFLKVFAIRFIVQIHVKVRRARINLFDDAILNLFKKCRFPATPNASNNLNDILCDKRDDF